MTNKTLGIGMLVAVGLAWVWGADPTYSTICGVLLAFFGIWGGIRLIQSNENPK